jgi:hypothetical protein
MELHVLGVGACHLLETLLRLREDCRPFLLGRSTHLHCSSHPESESWPAAPVHHSRSNPLCSQRQAGSRLIHGHQGFSDSANCLFCCFFVVAGVVGLLWLQSLGSGLGRAALHRAHSCPWPQEQQGTEVSPASGEHREVEEWRKEVPAMSRVQGLPEGQQP